jgi:hypothetical protein
VWIFEPNQLIRVILSRPPEEVHQERDEIIAELSNVTGSLVVVDDIRYHVDSSGHILHDWQVVLDTLYVELKSFIYESVSHLTLNFHIYISPGFDPYDIATQKANINIFTDMVT